MFFPKRILFISLIATSMSWGTACAQEPHSTHNGLHLSPKLTELLRSEMKAIMTGVQSLAVGIATADWKSVADTSAQIKASYILDQKLTPAQRNELMTSLPEHFKRMDSDFHHETKKLEVAATNQDAQLASFHYYRLIETCTACHTQYATSKLPGFSPAKETGHEH